MKLEIYDTTLRDGAQGAGVSFTDKEKLAVIDALDRLGICYIEAGYFSGSRADVEFFDRAASLPLKNADIVAFGSTRRLDETAQDCEWLRAAAGCAVRIIAIFGKASRRQAELVLGATPEQNLMMIRDTVEFLKAAGITGYNPWSSLVNVVFPEPLRPTIPITCPGSMVNERSRMIIGPSAV